MQKDIDLMQILRVPNKEIKTAYKGNSRALHMGKPAAKRGKSRGKRNDWVQTNQLSFPEINQLSVFS